MLMRIVAAVAVLVSAAVHFALWVAGVRNTEFLGPAFLLNAVGGLAVAVLLVAWGHWLPLLLAVGFGASTLGAFVIAATVGLFGIHSQWAGFEEITSAVAEVVAIGAGLAGLWQEYSPRGRERRASGPPVRRQRFG